MPEFYFLFNNSNSGGILCNALEEVIFPVLKDAWRVHLSAYQCVDCKSANIGLLELWGVAGQSEHL